MCGDKISFHWKKVLIIWFAHWSSFMNVVEEKKGSSALSHKQAKFLSHHTLKSGIELNWMMEKYILTTLSIKNIPYTTFFSKILHYNKIIMYIVVEGHKMIKMQMLHDWN